MKRAYREIMERVQVTPEMRRRVLERVAEEAPLAAPKSARPLRRYAPLAACLALLLAGGLLLPQALERGREQPSVLTVPSITETSSLQALSALVGFEVAEEFSLPFPVEETTYCSYWNELAQVTYRGGAYTAVYRQSLGTGDNSGDYSTYGAVQDLSLSGRTVTLKGDGETCALALWTDGTYAYSLSLSPGVEEDVWRFDIFS